MSKNKFLKLYCIDSTTIYVNESNITHIEKTGRNDIAVYVIGKADPIIGIAYFDKVELLLTETLGISDIS